MPGLLILFVFFISTGFTNGQPANVVAKSVEVDTGWANNSVNTAVLQYSGKTHWLHSKAHST